MQIKSAKKVDLSEKQRKILTEYAVGTHTPLHLKKRSQIVLNADKGWSNNTIEKEMGLDTKTVNRWRDRYSSRCEELKTVEAEVPLKLRSKIKEILSDNQRPGCPSTFTDEQVAAIIVLACEDPYAFT